MKEISNQTLAFLLMLAIVISLGGTFISLKKLDQLTSGRYLAGFAVSSMTGNINLTVTDTTSINFSTANITFGSGTVCQEFNNCSLDTLGNTNGCCVGFTTTSTPLTVQNIGNNNVTLNLSFAQAADAFLGGTAAINSYLFRVNNNSGAPGCDSNSSGGGMNYTAYTEVATTIPYTVCNRLKYTVAKDKVDVNINITIPEDSLLGLRTTTITATGITN